MPATVGADPEEATVEEAAVVAPKRLGSFMQHVPPGVVAFVADAKAIDPDSKTRKVADARTPRQRSIMAKDSTF
jgi:hypothetical protein